MRGSESAVFRRNRWSKIATLPGYSSVIRDYWCLPEPTRLVPVLMPTLTGAAQTTEVIFLEFFLSVGWVTLMIL